MSSSLPSRSEAWGLLAAARPPDWVPGHCHCVECLADAMAARAEGNGLAVDRDLVRVGSLLHDIGRAKEQGPRHAWLGGQMLRGQVPEVLVRIVERHTGAGLTRADVEPLGIPVDDYVPTTLEEKIVAHADNLYGGDRRRTLAYLEDKYEAKGLPDAWRRIEALHAELADMLDADPEVLVPSDLPRPA